MSLPGTANLNTCWGAFNWSRGSFDLGFHYAHRCTLTASPTEDAVETVCSDVDPVQAQASGILGSPVGTQLQVKETVFLTKCSLFFMVPPRSVRAWALEPDADERSLVAARRNRLLVREGESGLRHQRLTRSIHRTHIVKSGKGIVDSQATGGLQSANHDTGKNSTYSEVLVRIRCSYFSCKEGNSLQPLCTIPPLGIVKAKRRILEEKIGCGPPIRNKLASRRRYAKVEASESVRLGA
jgi:hypothetical protein